MIFNLEQSLFSAYWTWYQNEISCQKENFIWIENQTMNSLRNDLYWNEMSFDRYHANNTEKYMEMEWTCSRMKVIRVWCTLVGRLGKKNDSISIWWWLECFLFLLFFFTTFGLSFLKMWKQYYWFSTLTCKITIESKAVKFTTIYSPSKVIPGQMFNSEH